MEKKTNKRLIFWIRFAFYALFGLIIPILFLAWRFELFSKVSKLSIGGWGIVAIIIVGIFFIKLIKAVRKGLPFSFGTQVLEGLCKVTIPLLVLTFITNYMQSCVEEMYQFLFVLTFSETFALIINPIPQWAHENKIEEKESIIKNVLSNIGIMKNDNTNK